MADDWLYEVQQEWWDHGWCAHVVDGDYLCSKNMGHSGPHNRRQAQARVRNGREQRLSRLVDAVSAFLSAPTSEMYDRVEDLQLTFEALTPRDHEALRKCRRIGK